MIISVSSDKGNTSLYNLHIIQRLNILKIYTSPLNTEFILFKVIMHMHKQPLKYSIHLLTSFQMLYQRLILQIKIISLLRKAVI